MMHWSMWQRLNYCWNQALKCKTLSFVTNWSNHTLIHILLLWHNIALTCIPSSIVLSLVPRPFSEGPGYEAIRDGNHLFSPYWRALQEARRRFALRGSKSTLIFIRYAQTHEICARLGVPKWGGAIATWQYGSRTAARDRSIFDFSW